MPCLCVISRCTCVCRCVQTSSVPVPRPRPHLPLAPPPASSVTAVRNYTLLLSVQTSCCSTDTEKPHRGCHLSNNFWSTLDIPCTSQWARSCPSSLQIASSPDGIRAPPNIHVWFFGPIRVQIQTATRLVQPFWHSSWL